jgi:phenylalanyl-tRNA synthetase alpha chain
VDTARIVALVDSAESIPALEEARVALLGKKGEITGLLKQLGGLAPEERAAFGARVNVLKQEAEARIAERKALLEARAEEDALARGWVAVTAPAEDAPRLGRLHPITLLLEEVVDHFTGLGFEVASGPEIEDEWHNFDALNVPKDHPARDMWDTFWLKPLSARKLLRTHTSPVQIRHMEANKDNLPIRVVAPGKTFRHEATDATHEAQFFQMEGQFPLEQLLN